MTRPLAATSYAEIDTPAAMRADAAVARRALSLVDEAAAEGAPSLRYADYPAEVGKPEIEVSEAAARLAAVLEVYL
ncbi:MAG TPA: hypothetical protein VHW64_11145 [Nocardioides sp.]|uniref:hypothetical protein n=1 Tax=Nocardioides sp. TaxID=35761 RepID=UPI002E2ECE54|nr:hypothetical protein [Nocardioides sp.]HEX3931256.1 hypothetical protein [Nocardioides sp.]